MNDKKDLTKFEERFLSLFPENAFKDYNSCWLWKGKLESNGYGRMFCGGKRYGVHQLSYLIFNGAIPQGNLIRHTCDNKSCVNPKHLILGDHKDNSLDMMKRTSPIYTLLNEECVKVIKWMLKYKPYHGLGKKLADLHGIHVSTISDIKSGKRWGWVNV